MPAACGGTVWLRVCVRSRTPDPERCPPALCCTALCCIARIVPPHPTLLLLPPCCCSLSDLDRRRQLQLLLNREGSGHAGISYSRASAAHCPPRCRSCCSKTCILCDALRHALSQPSPSKQLLRPPLPLRLPAFLPAAYPQAQPKARSIHGGFAFGRSPSTQQLALLVSEQLQPAPPGPACLPSRIPGVQFFYQPLPAALLALYPPAWSLRACQGDSACLLAYTRPAAAAQARGSERSSGVSSVHGPDDYWRIMRRASEMAAMGAVGGPGGPGGREGPRHAAALRCRAALCVGRPMWRCNMTAVLLDAQCPNPLLRCPPAAPAPSPPPPPSSDSGHGRSEYARAAPRSEAERTAQRKAARLSLDTSGHTPPAQSACLLACLPHGGRRRSAVLAVFCASLACIFPGLHPRHPTPPTLPHAQHLQPTAAMTTSKSCSSWKAWTTSTRCIGYTSIELKIGSIAKLHCCCQSKLC